jgi:hypothetical protein
MIRYAEMVESLPSDFILCIAGSSKIASVAIEVWGGDIIAGRLRIHNEINTINFICLSLITSLGD